MMLFIQAYRMGVETFFFFSYAKQKDARAMYSILMNYFVIVMSIILLMLVSGIDLIKYFLGSQEYWKGIGVVPILLLANLFFGVYIHLSVWYKLSDRTRYGAYISILGAFITVIINMSFYSHYGIRGFRLGYASILFWHVRVLICVGQEILLHTLQLEKK